MTDETSRLLQEHQKECGSYEYTKRRKKRRGKEFHDIYYRCMKCSYEVKDDIDDAQPVQVQA